MFFYERNIHYMYKKNVTFSEQLLPVTLLQYLLKAFIYIYKT